MEFCTINTHTGYRYFKLNPAEDSSALLVHYQRFIKQSTTSVTMPKQNQFKDVTPATALSMIKKGALLVDVRESGEIERKAFDVSEVLSVPMSRFQSCMQDIPTDRKVIIACHTGARSAMAARILSSQGHSHVHNMQYGITRWEHEGLPVKTKPAQSPFAWMMNMLHKQA
jgi:rhodanese-related sulfurtransferase